MPESCRRTWLACGACVLLVALAVLTGWPGGLRAADSGSAPVDVAGALEEIKDYRFGDGRDGLRRIERLVYLSESQPDLRRRLAGEMGRMLDRSDVTVDCKEFLCRQLGLVGSAGQVPALVELLEHEELSFAARAALARMPGEKAERAMRAALEDLSGAPLVGVIHTLGQRRDAGAVDAMAEYLDASDPAVARAAVVALGRIGTGRAVDALRRAEDSLPAGAQRALNDALLNRAERLLQAGERAEAGELYGALFAPGRPAHVRVAALPGLLKCRPDRDLSTLTDVLKAGSPPLRRAAVQYVRGEASAGTVKRLAGRLADFPAAVQAGLLDAFAERGLEAARPAVERAVDSEHGAVRLAAIAALGRLGDASTVPLLVDRLSGAEGQERRAVLRGLVRLQGHGVNRALLRRLERADAALRLPLIDVLTERSAAGSVPVLLQMAGGAEPGVRERAFRALAELAGPDAVPDLIELLLEAGEAERGAAAEALARVCGRSERPEPGAEIVSALGRADTEARCALLSVLGRVGGRKALDAVRRALGAGEAQVREAALRALVNWPDASPMPDLLSVAREAEGTRTRAMALRGFANVAGRPEGPLPDRKAELFAQAFALADRPREKKTLLGSLGAVSSPRALRLALDALDEEEVSREAGMAVVQLAEVLWQSHRGRAASALRELLGRTEDTGLRSAASVKLLELARPRNLARGATAASPDGLDKDGGAAGDRGAIDGREDTYWDEVDGRDLYRLRVTFEEPTRVSLVSITGYQHHNYAPKDFDVLCDGKVVKEVRGAEYSGNRLVVGFRPTRCTELELKITGYYGQSPAIRELGVYDYRLTSDR